MRDRSLAEASARCNSAVRLSEPGGGVERDADVVARQLRRFLFRKVHQIAGRRAPPSGNATVAQFS